MASAENPRVENPTNPPSNPPPAAVGPPLIPPRVSVTAALRNAHQMGGRGGLGGGGGAGGGGGGAAPNNNNAGEIPQQTQNLFYMRDRLFLALFFRVTLIYARTCPKTMRRILEFLLLIQAVVLLFLLCYIHIVYTRTPITCLNQYKDSWPRDGILRVEITTDAGDDYDISKSYEKEEKLRQRVASSQINHYSDDILSMMLSADQILLDRVVSTAGELISSVTSSRTATTATTTGENEEEQAVNPTASVGESASESSISSTSTTGAASAQVEAAPPPQEGESGPPEVSSSEGAEIMTDLDVDGGRKDIEGSHPNKSAELEEDSLVAAAEGEDKEVDAASSSSFAHSASGEGSAGGVMDEMDPNNPSSPYFNKTLEEIEIMKMEEKNREDEKVLKTDVSDIEMFTNAVFQDQAYIVEYALEYGFLRLSPETRQRLNIPVKIVTLDPTKESCFGDSFSVFLLENFLGYDDILMSSIKNLAEAEENKGYLRNVVSGEQFRFVPMWMARTSYIPAMLIMLVFTVSISMLLRYSHHQIFIFIVDLLNNIEGAGSIHIPAAPLFTVILALVGMEAIMSEFFNDTSTAFYVILIVWVADQYDSVCSHTIITKTFWVRFFYLYHFAFYAYHYRFNGQYSGLALLVSWSFIQHSMVYFYHHYELPAILRQAQQPELNTQFLNDDQNQGPPSAPPADGNAGSDATATEAAAASATGATTPGPEAGSSARSPVPPVVNSATGASPTTNNSTTGNTGESTVPISNITVTLSSSDSSVPPVSVEISQQHYASSSSTNSDNNSVRRRVTSASPYTNSSNTPEFPPTSSSSLNEVRSFTEALRTLRTGGGGSNEVSGSAANSPDFSAHVSVSFSADPITSTSTTSRGSSAADVSSLLGSASLSAGATAAAAGPVYNPITRL